MGLNRARATSEDFDDISRGSAKDQLKGRDGKSAQDNAILVMKMVYEKTGTEIGAVQGKSASDKLHSLRVEPVVGVLRNESWRHFFTGKKTPADLAITEHFKELEVRKARMQRTMSALQGLPPPNTTNTIADQQQRVFDGIAKTFEKMVARVEALWQTLQIPQADREFYRQSLCLGPPQSMDHCREIARYIDVLHNHRHATINVLKAIDAREMSLKRCFDVLEALHRKSMHSPEDEHGSSNHRVVKSRVGGGMDSAELWRKELLLGLKDLQTLTVAVIRNVQIWRRNMWRPRGFVWRNQNYLTKIRMDMNVLDSDMYRKQLWQCGLQLSDLQCVAFPEAQREAESGAASSGSSSMRALFLKGQDAAELSAASRVVLSEVTLCNALKIEARALQAKKVFIPTLKLIFADGAGRAAGGSGGGDAARPPSSALKLVPPEPQLKGAPLPGDSHNNYEDDDDLFM